MCLSVWWLHVCQRGHLVVYAPLPQATTGQQRPWYTLRMSKTSICVVEGGPICFVPEEWRAKLFGCGPFTSQARLTFYQTDVSFVLLLEINTKWYGYLSVGFWGTSVPISLKLCCVHLKCLWYTKWTCMEIKCHKNTVCGRLWCLTIIRIVYSMYLKSQVYVYWCIQIWDICKMTKVLRPKLVEKKLILQTFLPTWHSKLPYMYVAN